jgi:hypothetical protein
MLIDVPFYIELQRRGFEIFRYLSCHERNFGAHSVALEGLLISTCSFFDSQCQTLIREKAAARHNFRRQAEVDEFDKKVEGRRNFNCGDYRKLLEGDFGLSNRILNLNPHEESMYLNPLSYAPNQINGYSIVPFQEWRADETLDWWNAFTNLKHDRLQHHTEATLINTIRALAATYVMLTLQNEADFKQGHISPELYDLFFPKYWEWDGRIAIMNFRWR